MAEKTIEVQVKPGREVSARTEDGIRKYGEGETLELSERQYKAFADAVTPVDEVEETQSDRRVIAARKKQEAAEEKAKEFRDQLREMREKLVEAEAENEELRSRLAEIEAEAGGIDATDAAVELAKDEGVDLDDVKGTGDDGRILKSDVQEVIDAREAAKAEAEGEEGGGGE